MLSSNPMSVQEMAKEVYQEDYYIKENANGSFMLVFREIKSNPNQLFPTVFFFVWSQADAKIIYQESLAQGKVKWISPYQILCESVPGRMNEEEKSKKYIFDVLSCKTETQLK